MDVGAVTLERMVFTGVVLSGVAVGGALVAVLFDLAAYQRAYKRWRHGK